MIRSQLGVFFKAAFIELGYTAEQAAVFGEVVRSDRPDLAHYQCNGALGAAKSVKKNPRELAQTLLEGVQPKLEVFLSDKIKKILKTTVSHPLFSLSIAGPGFINLLFSDFTLALLAQEIEVDSRLGVEKVAPKKVIIDFGSPNVAKAMHVGHLRSSIIGDALQRVHRFAGNTVIGDNHFGDWGTPMGMLICEVAEKQPNLPYFNAAFTGPYPSESPVSLSDLETLYPAASQRYKTDKDFESKSLAATHELQQGRPGYKALWKHFVTVTVNELSAEFKNLNIEFDTWLGESFYEDKMGPMVESLKARGIAKMSEGAWVIELADQTAPDMPPLILVKSGGGFLYHTSDLACVDYRVTIEKADRVLYVVDKRQSLHFKQVFKAAKIAGYTKSTNLEHVAFGTMNGPDGKPFKTRTGGVLKLKELMRMVREEALKRIREMGNPYSDKEIDAIADAVSLATLRYADLKNNRLTDYIFDIEKFSSFEGNTGPYLLYAAVRIKSILRKAAEQGLKTGPIIAPKDGPSGISERQLLLGFHLLADAVDRAIQNSEPHHLCDFGYELSQRFNYFYKECHILKEPDLARQGSWLSLCALTLRHLELSLGLLGLQVPDRM